MNKRFTRLTALLLALIMLVSTAYASSASVTKGQYDSSLDKMIDDLSLIPTELETPIESTVEIDTTTLVPTYAAGEGVVTPADSITVTAQTAPEDVGGYQWMIKVGDVWANIDGATEQTLNLTYAMAKPAMDANGKVLLRCRLIPAVQTYAEGETEAVYEDEITYTVNDAVTYTEQAGTMNVEVTQYTENEEPDADYEAAWAFQNAANTSAVSTYGLMTAAETESTVTMYSVVINYLFKDNTIAADAYTARLAEGSSLKVEVKFPTVTGYLPYLDNEQTNSLPLNITNLSGDVTYNVVYLPTNVEYTVEHHLQKVDAETADKNETNYALQAADTETFMGLTGDPVPDTLANEDEYPGFYALLYKQDKIAADGSTTVKVYYNRNYYLMNFDLSGGYGVEPIYARYEAPISVGTPTRAGYQFLGWSTTPLANTDPILDGVGTADDVNVAALPTTMPANNVTYYAVWEMNETAKVSVVLWGENPNDEEYSYITTGELELKSGTSYTYNGTDQLYLLCDKEEHSHTNCTLTCGKTEHTSHTEACLGNCTHKTHTLDCYYVANSGTLEETTKPNQITVENLSDGAVYTYTEYDFLTYYYLYLNGKWYRSVETGEWYEGESAGQREITLSCSHTTHTNECYSCETHSHTDACYGCGKEAHAHDSSCTGEIDGLNSTLWTFVKSDTVTVNPDGSTVINVYYDRTTFTMTFKASGNNGATLATITDKWGADIKQRFENISKANTFLWSAETDGSDPWTSFMDVMPAENRTYYARTTNSSNTQTATYLVQSLGKEAGTKANYEILYTVSVKYGNNLYVSEEEYVDIEGFTFNSTLSTGTHSDYDGAEFYYDRNQYAIEFYSPSALLRKNENIYFEADLSSYNWTPDASMAPSQYEAGTVVFEGWYLNPECTGEKYDFTTHTMPAAPNNGDTALVLYAKWVPVMRTVEFYLDYNAYVAGTQLTTHPEKEVPHGTVLDGSNEYGTVEDPENGDYTFVGWFYEENGEEYRIDFSQMPVTKNLKVYGKWISNTQKPYTIYYKLQGTTTDVAASTTDSELAGMLVTVNAKVEDQLYEQYQNGYFPTVPSHSLTIDINGTDENKLNEYTFWYVQRDIVPYIVQYVTDTVQDQEDALGTIVIDGKTYYIVAEEKVARDNTKAIVDEQFKVVPGYMPDAYQKRLILNGATTLTEEEIAEGKAMIDKEIVDEEGNKILIHPDNVLIFYYHVDTEHAYYKISHWTENLGKDANGDPTWTKYTESSDMIGDIDTVYKGGDPLTIPGFTFDKVEYVVGDEIVATYTKDQVDAGLALTNEGMEIKLYYTRNSYPYQVQYLEQGTDKILHDPKNGSGLYGDIISEDAIDIANYTLVSATSQTLNIQIENPADVAAKNIIIFYYQENYSTLNYKIVDPAGNVHSADADCGTLSRYGETIPAVTGVATGSTATASGNAYKFVGWYSDPSCKEEYLLWEGATWEPTLEEGEAWVDGTTYYAKFEWNISTLTITKTGMAAGESAIFKVTAVMEDGEKTFTVTVPNDGSVTIYGVIINSEYSVTELGDWTWRYTSEATGASGTIATNGSTAAFTNTKSNDQWLDDEYGVHNEFNVNGQGTKIE